MWFNILNRKYKVQGKASYYWKMYGKKRTLGIDSNLARKNLMNDLQE